MAHLLLFAPFLLCSRTVFFRQYSAVYDGKIFSYVPFLIRFDSIFFMRFVSGLADLAAFFRIPFDGDVHYLHVRKDILDKYSLPVPETWEDYLYVASQVRFRAPRGR